MDLFHAVDRAGFQEMHRSGRIAFGCPSYHVTMGDTKMPDIILFDIILVE